MPQSTTPPKSEDLSPEMIDSFTSAYAQSIARLDAVNLLRNAGTLFTASFGAALSDLEHGGDPTRLNDAFFASMGMLTAAYEFYQAVDAGKDIDLSLAERLITQGMQDHKAPDS